MIDWTKEKATKNYCGYCNGTPTGSSCDGDCFKSSPENRVNHILVMLTTIPIEIEKLQKRQKDYKDSLSA
jgi:hypothetical protein